MNAILNRPGTSRNVEPSSNLCSRTPAPPADVQVMQADERAGFDYMVDVLKSLDFEYICANPGSSFRGLHESLINYGGRVIGGNGNGGNAELRAAKCNGSIKRNIPVLLAAAVIAASPRVEAQEPSDAPLLLAQYGCVVCHGAEGSGTAAGPSIAAGEQSLPEFIASVRQPLRTMPGYDAQPAPPPLSSIPLLAP